jgi:CxxC-x17-CxxC domain-containing protein
MFDDKTIKCRDCGNDFTFTAGEQEFYQQKGFTNEPSRCPDCRRARKAENGGDRGGRQFYEATCAACGGIARIPFKPVDDRDVYCSDCFAKR